MSEEGLARFALLPALHSPRCIGAVIDAAYAAACSTDLLPLAALMPEEARQIVAEHAPSLLEKD